ncbi:hypothetical protein [Clostridium sp. FP1]|uniref:hypothetical protein n=1 Tax=Clostridium sp. FP1 TaxID=2724076 RepID=UPI001CC9B296|nr:hypothetical protein [Clostridium sp. FP1]MBZ9637615.1 hypothetical protein [Clostridium sp. FP1]
MDLINEAALNIKNKYIEKYTELISDDRDYMSFVSDISYELFNKVNLNNAVEYNADQLLQLLTRSRRITKKRWIELEFKNGYNLLDKIQEQASTVYNSDIAAFKLIYKANNLDELKQDMTKLQQLTDDKLLCWRKDDNSYFVEFEYLERKTQRQLLQSFQSDFNWVALHYIKKNMYLNNSISMPISVSDLPVDISGRRKVSLDTMACITAHNDNKQEEQYYYNTQKYNDTQISTYVDINYVQKNSLQHAFKHFNALDRLIFIYILSQKKADFFETRKIIVDISDIVKNVFLTTGAKNYETVKSSIVKMANIQMQYIVKGQSGFISRIFSEVYLNEKAIGNTNKKNTSATIFVSDIIVSELMEKQTLNIYGDKINDISSEALSLVCAIQGRRMKFYGEGKNITEDLLPYYFFQLKFRMSDKRKKRNLPTIKALLEELQKNHIIIKSFTQVSDAFQVVYYNLNTIEIKNFANNIAKSDLLPLEN